MESSTIAVASSSDYAATSRPAIRSRPSIVGGNGISSPSSPRTPLLGRSLSSQFGSPSTFRTEQEDHIVWELGARHISAGFAGESRPRCVVGPCPENARRIGDYSQYDLQHRRKSHPEGRVECWGSKYELYRTDIRGLDLGLVEDKLERIVRTAHTEYLQLDQKPRKVALVLPSLLPTPLLEIMLKVLFNHFSQPPSVILLTSPILACVGAGLRNGLVVDIGWEETVVTAVGEYKEVSQRRSVRARKMLTRSVADVLSEEVQKKKNDGRGGSESSAGTNEIVEVSFELAEEVTQRVAWCRQRNQSAERTSTVDIPIPDSAIGTSLAVPFQRLSDPAENTFFNFRDSTGDDDHNLPLHILIVDVLLSLPLDLRACCTSRIILTGGVSTLPGLKPRLLQELIHVVETRGWDPVRSYGSATTYHQREFHERPANILALRNPQNATTEDAGNEKNEAPPLSPSKKPLQDSIHPRSRIHDDQYDPITLKAERRVGKGLSNDADLQCTIRGVETLGAWAGASLVANLRVKGSQEVEREDFVRHGLKDAGGWL